MRVALKPHPDTPSAAPIGIVVEVARTASGQFTLRYLVSGSIADLSIPPPSAPERRDELWQNTCFEAFIRPSPDEAYWELNFAPSTEWAAYRFSGYRSGMADAELEAPAIETTLSSEYYQLRATAHLPGAGLWKLGLSAVIEEANGRKSYWSLNHPPGKADFHHPDSFVLELPATS